MLTQTPGGSSTLPCAGPKVALPRSRGSGGHPAPGRARSRLQPRALCGAGALCSNAKAEGNNSRLCPDPRRGPIPRAVGQTRSARAPLEGVGKRGKRRRQRREKQLPRPQGGIPGPVPPAPGRHSGHRDPSARHPRRGGERDRSRPERLRPGAVPASGPGPPPPPPRSGPAPPAGPGRAAGSAGSAGPAGAAAGPRPGRCCLRAAAEEDKPSPKELEELELLNRALEKALKVRKSILETPLEAQGARGQKWAGEAHAPKKAEEQQVPVPVEDVPECRKVRAGSKKPLLLKKPSAHQLRAPYRTDPDVKKLQRKVPARCVSQGPRTAGISSKGLTSKQGRSHRTAAGARAREVSAAAEPQETPGLSESAPNEQQSFSGGDSSAVKSSTVAGKQFLDAGKKSCGFLGESSKSTAGAWGRSTSAGPGTLQEKGYQLKLPLPYRKAYSRNCRAWERCRLCQTSADAAAARTRFVERIQTTFEFCSPRLTPSPAEIEEELRGLQDVPSHLRQYMEAEPADPPTLQGEYESLLTLEGLQSTVSQCLQKLQLLQEALESQLRLCPDCPGDVGSCSPACVPGRGQTCDSADMLAVPLLCYSSLQELRDLFALKLQVSMLHQEIALQKKLGARREARSLADPAPVWCSQVAHSFPGQT
ncbi:tubulin epsilon and delta complex protein 2 isoform 3-T3 [Geothlypis trichas]